MLNKHNNGVIQIVAAFALCMPTIVWAEPDWKVRMDPALALADFPNLEIDRALGDSVSLGFMLWHHDRSDLIGRSQTSAGVRLDWYDRSVFTTGWHSNLIVKADWNEAELDRWRLKGTQTYQWAWRGVFLNAGIGVQLVTGTRTNEEGYYDYESWLLPGWELSIGRAF